MARQSAGRLRRRCNPVSTVLAGVALFGMVAATPAAASEGGASFYLLGSGGPGAGMLPPLEGIFFDNTAYLYAGSASAERRFVVGGNLVAGLDTSFAADFATVLWVPTTDILGGTLAIGGALPAGYLDINVEAVITGPGGNQVAISRADDAFVIGDPVATAALGWNLGGNAHAATSVMINIPIGHYREGQLANLAFHRWVVDWSTAVSWHDAQMGWDVSGKAGLTFNGTNDFTDYDTGTEFHLEAAVERIFSPSFSAGVQFYHLEQVTGDSGPGATLGPNEGRVSGVGVTAAYNFRIGSSPATLRARLFQEFGAENRLDGGTAAMLSLSVPLPMNLPPGAGGHTE